MPLSSIRSNRPKSPHYRGRGVNDLLYGAVDGELDDVDSNKNEATEDASTLEAGATPSADPAAVDKKSEAGEDADAAELSGEKTQEPAKEGEAAAPLEDEDSYADDGFEDDGTAAETQGVEKGLVIENEAAAPTDGGKDDRTHADFEAVGTIEDANEKTENTTEPSASEIEATITIVVNNDENDTQNADERADLDAEAEKTAAEATSSEDAMTEPAARAERDDATTDEAAGNKPSDPSVEAIVEANVDVPVEPTTIEDATNELAGTKATEPVVEPVPEVKVDDADSILNILVKLVVVVSAWLDQARLHACSIRVWASMSPGVQLS